MRQIVTAAVILALAAATASADAVLDRVDTAVKKGGKVEVLVEATLAAPGQIVLDGDVNGVPVSLRKAAKAGHRTYKFVVDPRRLGLRKLGTGLRFDLTARAAETGGTEAFLADIIEDIPIPSVVLPGFANEETPGGFAAFAVALDLASGGRYGVGAAKPAMRVHEYKSFTQSLAVLGKGLGKSVKAALKGTPFTKVDLVCYSYGGLVARSYLSQAGGLRVRNCVFVATPNEGTPIAYLAVGLAGSPILDEFLGENPGLADIAQQFLDANAQQGLRNMFPTYDWYTPKNGLTTIAINALLGSGATPLTALNATAPPEGVSFHAFFYTSTGVAEFGTVDVVNTSVLADVAGGDIDPAQIASGSGDGVVPAHSVTMDNVPAWKAAIGPNVHDLGVGSHLTILIDPAALTGIAAVLAQ